MKLWIRYSGHNRGVAGAVSVHLRCSLKILSASSIGLISVEAKATIIALKCQALQKKGHCQSTSIQTVNLFIVVMLTASTDYGTASI